MRHMTARLCIAAVVGLTVLLLPLSASSAAPLNVLTTHTVLQSIAKDVGRDHVSVSCLAIGKEDPHAISAKPSYMVNARRADLFIKIGMELEIGYEELVINGSRNQKIRFGQPGYLDASINALKLEVPTTRIDRSMGDVHPLGNPHYWLDPYNARIVAQSIADRLALLDPDNTADYQANCADFVSRVDNAMFGESLVAQLGGAQLWSLDLAGRLEAFLKDKGLAGEASGWYRQLKPLRNTPLITYHRSWVYFANRFGLTVVAELEPKPGIPPSPGHLRDVVQVGQQVHVPIILMEPYYNARAAEFVAEKVGARVVQVTNAVGGQPDVNDYISLIDNAVKKLTEGTPQEAGITG